MNNLTIISNMGKLKGKLHDLEARLARSEGMESHSDMRVADGYKRSIPKLKAEIASITGRIAVLEEDLKRSIEARTSTLNLNLLTLDHQLAILNLKREALLKERDQVK